MDLPLVGADLEVLLAVRRVYLLISCLIIAAAHIFPLYPPIRGVHLGTAVAPIITLYRLPWFIRIGGRLFCGERFREAFGWDVEKTKREGTITVHAGEYFACQLARKAAMEGEHT